jgi:hypothetical protein
MGRIGYMASIRLHSGNELVHGETKIFSRRVAAEKRERHRYTNLIGMTMERKRSLPDVMVEAIDLLSKFSIPLYIHDKANRPEQFGTGFFVRAGSAHFLVSAAHVLDVGRSKRIFFYPTPSSIRYLTGSVLTTGNPAQTAYDERDVAVMKLTGNAVPPFPEVDKFSMDLSYLQPAHLPRAGKHYVVVGFPGSKSRIDRHNKAALVSPYAYRSDSIDDTAYSAHSVDPGTHVVLPLDLKKGFDISGGIAQFPKPHGMSGSPIVVLYDVNEKPGDFRVFPVVAVAIEYRKQQKVLIGTDTRYVLEMIAQHLDE